MPHAWDGAASKPHTPPSPSSCGLRELTLHWPLAVWTPWSPLRAGRHPSLSTLLCEAITTYGSRGQQSTLTPGPAPTAGGQLSIRSLGLQAPLLSCTAHLQLGVTSQAGAETSFRQSRLPGQLSCSPKRASPRPRQNCLLSETSSPASQHCSATCPMGQPLLEANPLLEGRLLLPRWGQLVLSGEGLYLELCSTV